MIQRASLARIVAAVAAAWLLSLPFSASGALVYAVPGSTYFQNFDSLPNTPENVSLGTGGGGWTDDNAAPGANQFSIPGWYLHHPLGDPDGGSTGHSRFRTGAGTSGIASFMSFGASGSTERALGDLGGIAIADEGENIYIAVRIRNFTGVVLDRFTVSFAGEQWRVGALSFAQSMTFSFSTSASLVDDFPSQFTPVPELTFNSPIFSNISAAAVDGNTAGRVDIPAITISGLNWLPENDLWLRWTDINNFGNDHGLAIDDFSFSAAPIPEPSGISLVGLAALGMARRRRR